MSEIDNIMKMVQRFNTSLNTGSLVAISLLSLLMTLNTEYVARPLSVSEGKSRAHQLQNSRVLSGMTAVTALLSVTPYVLSNVNCTMSTSGSKAKGIMLTVGASALIYGILNSVSVSERKKKSPLSIMTSAGSIGLGVATLGYTGSKLLSKTGDADLVAMILKDASLDM